MLVTINDRQRDILAQTQASPSPLTLKQLQFYRSKETAKLSLTELEQEVDELIDLRFVEYHEQEEIGKMEFAYELSDHWYALNESQQEQLLTAV